MSIFRKDYHPKKRNLYIMCTEQLKMSKIKCYLFLNLKTQTTEIKLNDYKNLRQGLKWMKTIDIKLKIPAKLLSKMQYCIKGLRGCSLYDLNFNILLALRNLPGLKSLKAENFKKCNITNCVRALKALDSIDINVRNNLNRILGYYGSKMKLNSYSLESNFRRCPKTLKLVHLNLENSETFGRAEAFGRKSFMNLGFFLSNLDTETLILETKLFSPKQHFFQYDIVGKVKSKIYLKILANVEYTGPESLVAFYDLMKAREPEELIVKGLFRAQENSLPLNVFKDENKFLDLLKTSMKLANLRIPLYFNVLNYGEASQKLILEVIREKKIFLDNANFFGTLSDLGKNDILEIESLQNEFSKYIKKLDFHITLDFDDGIKIDSIEKFGDIVSNCAEKSLICAIVLNFTQFPRKEYTKSFIRKILQGKLSTITIKLHFLSNDSEEFKYLDDFFNLFYDMSLHAHKIIIEWNLKIASLASGFSYLSSLINVFTKKTHGLESLAILDKYGCKQFDAYFLRHFHALSTKYTDIELIA